MQIKRRNLENPAMTSANPSHPATLTGEEVQSSSLWSICNWLCCVLLIVVFSARTHHTHSTRLKHTPFWKQLFNNVPHDACRRDAVARHFAHGFRTSNGTCGRRIGAVMCWRTTKLRWVLSGLGVVPGDCDRGPHFFPEWAIVFRDVCVRGLTGFSGKKWGSGTGVCWAEFGRKKMFFYRIARASFSWTKLNKVDLVSTRENHIPII